jgi:hypothetical protein
VPETVNSSSLTPLSAGNDAAPVSIVCGHDNFELASPQTNYQPRSSITLYQSPGVSQNDSIPSVGAQNAAFSTLNADPLSADRLYIFNNAGNKPQFVGYNEVDPEKHLKRRDRVEDKQRKEHISVWHGACLKCKKVKKQCNGGEVCERCQRRGYYCIRTCSSCWSTKKLVCDEGFPCKNCQLTGRICVRPSPSSTRTGDVHSWDLTSVPSQAMRSTSSSTQVNNHIMSATGGQIGAPTAWNVRFDLTPTPCNTDKVDMMSQASYNVLLGSPPYSQQSTDVDLHRTLTKSSGTKVASEANSLQVPGKQHVTPDMRSEAADSISHFDDALYFSDQGSPRVEVFDDYPYDPQEDTS